MMRTRLFSKTLVFIALLFGIVTSVTTFFSAFSLHSVLMQEYESKAVSIARSLAESDLWAFVDNDAALLQSRIDSYLDLEGVAYVLVTSEQGEILAHTFVPAVPDSVLPVLGALSLAEDSQRGALRHEIFVQGIGQVVHVSMPVLAGAAGYVHVGMNKEVIFEYITTATLQQLAIAFTLFVLCVWAAYLLMRSVSRPLTALRDYADKVAAHDFSASITVTSYDEIGDLARSMQTMSADLSTMVVNLEQAVEEKTAELQDSVAYISAIMTNISDGLVVLDFGGRITRYNKAFEKMVGGLPEDSVGHFLQDILGVKNTNQSFFEHVLSSHATSSGEEIILHRLDGALLPVEVGITHISHHGVGSVICLLRDVTVRRRAEEELREARDMLEDKVTERTRELSRANAQLKLENAERRVVEQALRRTEERYRTIFENAIEGIFQSSPEGHIINVNPALARILGYEAADELVATVLNIPEQLYVNSQRREEFVEYLERDGEVCNFDFEAVRKDGTHIWITVAARCVKDKAHKTLYYEGFIEDITQRRETQEKLEHQAYHDPLTDLPNRALFQDHLNLALKRRSRRSEYEFAVLYLDLDRFKVVNDSLGHAVGDELLQYVSRQLRSCIREMDTVARFGGDEFAVLLEEIESAREAVRVARRIQTALNGPVNIQGHEVFTSASIGLVLQTDRYFSAEEVLRDADTAMYRAKELGKARFKVFNQRMHEQALRLMALETDLRRSVEREELEVCFQPIVDLENSRVVGFEALLRWQHPTLGRISPVEFIPLAEDAGLIGDLGRQVLMTSVSRVKEWNNRDIFPFAPKDIFVSINISGRQFMQPQLPSEVEELVSASGVNPGLLHFEITESVLMEQGSFAEDSVSRLRRLGIHMSIDDFGTGYSSLSYLQRMPVDTIKIDRSFILGTVEGEGGQSIVRSILSLGKSLNMNIIAEGVETLEQAAFLRALGCQMAQGFLYSRALSAEQVKALLSVEFPFGHVFSGDDFRDASGL